ncbi:hypothetical protein P3T37_000883 [Kitasatospora sp. MAA4]|uniref:hypothetical protein n=1 Tax=Kitasatospora sp. MAA4 TaxID=3035093 RepID=UPI0024743572|nr:hypothetical protein [Kitasatospora sp. MAA4]MDH6131514.1 hypothetical protein [Kitasatospora sp. MAA4]
MRGGRGDDRTEFNGFAIELTRTHQRATALCEAVKAAENPAAHIDSHALARSCRELADLLAANLADAEDRRLVTTVELAALMSQEPE